jgi:glycosyltransferase involved in cell wall biosynthesis
MEVMISASSTEPFGLVILEAMALGTPVVAVDAAGPSEIIESEKTGVLVSTNNEHALADAVEALLRDPARRREIAEAALQRFTTRFTAARTTDRFVETFHLLCSNGTRLIQGR